MTLEHVEALEPQAEDAARLLTAAEARVASRMKELEDANERRAFLEAALGAARHADSPASATAVGGAAAAVGAQQAICASIAGDLEADRAALAKEQAAAANVQALLASAKNAVLREERRARTTPAYLHDLVRTDCENAMTALDVFTSSCANIERSYGEVELDREKLRIDGLHVPLDPIHRILPLLEALAARGLAPEVGMDLHAVRNSMEHVARSAVHGIPERSTKLTPATLLNLLTRFGQRPAHFTEAFRLQLARLRDGARTVRDAEALEAREATERQAVANETYVPPARTPGPPTSGRALSHEAGPPLSPWDAMQQREAEFQGRVAASRERHSRVKR